MPAEDYLGNLIISGGSQCRKSDETVLEDGMNVVGSAVFCPGRTAAGWNNTENIAEFITDQ